MLTDIAGVVGSIAVVVGLCWALYGWSVAPARDRVSMTLFRVQTF